MVLGNNLDNVFVTNVNAIDFSTLPEEEKSNNGNHFGKDMVHQDNGWGNGDDEAPGGSLLHNNAENFVEVAAEVYDM